MRCVGCGVELLPGKRFCHACGARVGSRCDGCGATLDPAFRFCPDCGARVQDGTVAELPATTDPLARLVARRAGAHGTRVAAVSGGPVEGERKQVTVLFCDLVDSTAIASRLDPEDYHELLEAYLDTAFPEIVRREGVVNLLAGDGLMALFGAPVAHEDAPQRAVKAALAILQVIEPLAERLRARHGVELRVRIGIHTGPVVVGTVGSDHKMDYTAIGDTTNLASRLQTLARPGQILVSEATWRLVRGVVGAEPTGPLVVRGKEAPVLAYAVTSWRGGDSLLGRAGGAGAELTPFVGRAAELARLEVALSRVERGETQVVTVVGDAGSGKSRLLYEFRTRLDGGGTVVFEGRCASMMQSLPYHLFMSMFARWFGLDWEDPAEVACTKVSARFGFPYEEVERRYPLLCRFLSLPIEGLAEQPADELQRETFDAVARLILGAAEGAPVVVMLEDLHWIDEPSRELLEHLLRRLVGARVLVVVTHRPDVALAWHVPTALTQVVLGHLAAADVRGIVRAVAGGRLPFDLEQLLVQQANGSPFFAEELVRGLLDERHLVRSADGTLALGRALEAIPIPGTVQEVLAARLDTLRPAGKRVIQVAAVLGRQLRRAQLEQLLASEGIDVERELGELERRGLLHRKNLLAGDEWRFGESLTQEIAYETLLLRQRRQLHERVGRLLEAEGEARGAEHAALMAHHWSRSDDQGKAVDALLRAAREAERVPSYKTAADLYRRTWLLAETLLGEGEDGRYHRIALDAIEGACRLTAFYGAIDLEEAERAAVRGRELADLLGDREALAWLTGAHGIFVMTRPNADFSGGLALVEEGLALAGAAGLQHLVQRLTRNVCMYYAADGRVAQARSHLEPLLAELEAAGHRERRSDVYLSTLAVRDLLRYAEDDLAGAIASATGSVELAGEANNRAVLSALGSLLAAVHLLRAEYAEAKRWADLSLEIGEAIANANVLAAGGSIGFLARQALGESPDAAPFVERIEHGLASVGPMHLNLRFVAEALLAAGDLERADRVSAALVASRGGRLRQACMLVGRGDVLVRLGRYAEALGVYGEARALGETIGSGSVVAGALIGAAEAAAACGQPPGDLAKVAALCDSLSLRRYAARLALLGGAGTPAPSRT